MWVGVTVKESAEEYCIIYKYLLPVRIYRVLLSCIQGLLYKLMSLSHHSLHINHRLDEVIMRFPHTLCEINHK